MSPDDGAPVRLTQFLAPRFWPAWLLIGWMRLMAMLPWPWAVRLHKLVGHFFGRMSGRQRRIVRRNIEICLPEAESEKLTDAFFESLGAAVAEMSVAWFGRPARLRRLVDVNGIEHVLDALTGGNGVILLTGHFTTFEIACQVIKDRLPLFAFMFTRRHNPLLNEIQLRGRLRGAHECFANDDVRAMLQRLERNAAVWYAPDQASSGKLGASVVLVPFFGEPAMTSTSTSRIARVSGASVVPMHSFRLPDDSGYTLEFQPALEAFPSGDAEADTRRINETIEAMVRKSPDQYLWNHRRFKGRPAPHPDVYRDAADA